MTHNSKISFKSNLIPIIGKFSSAIGKLMIGKTLATNGEEVTNVMIRNNVLGNYW